MIRINAETPETSLQDIKVGDMVTDTFSKTGKVERIEILDEWSFKVYVFHLETGRSISLKK